MCIKSNKYTQGEFKAVKDLVLIEESLLVSSQMANSLLLLQQHEKLLKDAQQEITKQNEVASEPVSEEPRSEATKEMFQEDDEHSLEPESIQTAPLAEVDDNDDVLADLNA